MSRSWPALPLIWALVALVLLALWGLAFQVMSDDDDDDEDDVAVLIDPAGLLELRPGDVIENIFAAMVLEGGGTGVCPSEGATPLLSGAAVPRGARGCVRLANTDTEPGIWRVDFEDTYGGGMSFFVGRMGVETPVLIRGAADDPAEEPVMAGRRLASLPIVVGPGETVTLSVIITAPDEIVDADPVLRPEAEFDAVVLNRAHGFGALFGAFGLLIVFVIVFARLLGSQPALRYAVYLTATVLSFGAAEGYLGGLFPTRGLVVHGLADRMIDALQVCSHLLFVAAFLGSAGTGGKAPARLRLLAFAAAAVLIAATGYSWLTGGVEGVVRYHDLSYELDPLFEFGVHDLPELASAAVMVAWLIAMLVASALLLREGANGAALFALGALLLVGGLLFNSFGDEVIEGLDDENFALPYIFLLDGLLFAAAMVRQAFGLRTERDDALAQELAATREQARLSQTLLTTREDRDRARARAEVHRSRLALAGHDLRQPLTSLRLAIDAADDTNAELGDKLRDSLDYLRSLLDDILSDTMPEPATDGHAAPLTGMEDTPLAVVFANARRMFDDEARAKGLSLEVAETDVVVSTDPVTLIRMVSNLVSNAVKYTDAGGITVSASENDGRVRIDVADTGPGMEPDEIGSILQSYTRGTASDGTDGTGIGLSSVQSHARALGLALEVQSTPGQGSVFSLVGLRAV